MKSLNQLQDEQVQVANKMADAAMIAATALSRFIDLLERMEKRMGDEVATKVETAAKGKVKHGPA